MDPKVAQKFDTYPDHIRPKLTRLRELIYETAKIIDEQSEVEESLKWGEPSYRIKKGSPIRFDWKPKAPEQYAMYFSCSTSLVATFRILYENTFQFEGNRAIVFSLEEDLPLSELKHCITLAMSYHRVKHLPLLGA